MSIADWFGSGRSKVNNNSGFSNMVSQIEWSVQYVGQIVSQIVSQWSVGQFRAKNMHVVRSVQG